MTAECDVLRNQSADNPESPHMLVISSYHFSHDASMEMIRRVRYRLVMETSGCVIDYLELNAVRNSNEALENKFRPFGKAIASGRYQLVLALYDDAVKMLTRHSAQLPPGMPVVAYANDDVFSEFRNRHGNLTGVVGNSGVIGALDLGLTLRPKTKNLLVITDPAGTGPNDAIVLKAAIEKKRPTVSARFINAGSMTAGQLFDLGAGLPPDSLVIFALYRDYMRDGYPSVVTFARDFCRRVSAPCVVTSGLLSGVGSVGGFVTATDVIGENLADLVCQTLAKGDAQNIPIRSEIHRDVVNVEVANHYGIKAKNFPRNATLMNYTPPWWVRRKNEAIAWGVAALALLLVVAGSWWSYIREKKRAGRERELFSALPCRAYILDGDGCILNAKNSGNAWDVKALYPNASDELKQLIAATASSGERKEFEKIDGKMRYHFMLTPLSGRVFGDRAMLLSVYVCEISEPIGEAEKSMNGLLRAVFDGLPFGICVKDAAADLRRVLTNHKFSALTGGGRAADAMFEPEVFRTMDLQALSSDRPVMAQKEVTDENGRLHFFEVTKLPLHFDGRRYVSSIVNDMTDDRALEARQRNLLEDLNLRLETERIVNSCMHHVIASVDTGRTIGEILNIVGVNVESDACRIFNLGEDGRIEFRFEWLRNQEHASDDAEIDTAGFHDAIELLRAGKNVMVADVDDPQPGLTGVADYLRKRGMSAAVFAGIRRDDALIGFADMEFSGGGRKFSDREIRLLTEICALWCGRGGSLAQAVIRKENS